LSEDLVKNLNQWSSVVAKSPPGDDFMRCGGDFVIYPPVGGFLSKGAVEGRLSVKGWRPLLWTKLVVILQGVNKEFVVLLQLYKF